MAIAVAGASGAVGSRVVQDLLEEGTAAVVALARRPGAVPAAARLKVRRADYDDPASLRAALVGVATLVFISSDGLAASMRRHHEHVIAAASDTGVEHVVYTSILDVAPDSRFYYAAVHRDTEAVLARSGVGHCLARTSIFADYFVSAWLEPSLESGTLALPAGSGRMSLVTRGDVARALAGAALARREGVVELTGPAALAADEICRATVAVIGRALRYLALEEAEYRQRLAQQGAPAWLLDAYSTMFTSVREGRFARVSTDIPLLTGRPQEPYAEFIRSAGVSVPGPGRSSQ
jgi:NAD(P)H dehydrogenase (quinone)